MKVRMNVNITKKILELHKMKVLIDAMRDGIEEEIKKTWL